MSAGRPMDTAFARWAADHPQPVPPGAHLVPPPEIQEQLHDLADHIAAVVRATALQEERDR